MVRKKIHPEGAATTAAASESEKISTENAVSASNLPPVRPCLTVGIGASAGAQAALEQLFTSMPVDCGLAFVVIMHLHPDGPSYLPEMLGRCTPMPVLIAEEGMPLLPNSVLVIPPGLDLTVVAGRVRLEARERTREPHHPIDRFFLSLATDAADRGVAVLLSGFGIDGSTGVKAIREAGGAVLVQEPASAVNPAMPKSAIDTGAVDFVLPAEEIAARIAEIARGDCVLPQRSCRVATLDDELAAIFSMVKLKTGHDFSSYKKNTVIRRIERRMAMNEVSGIGKYIALIEDNPQEAQALCQDILIGVTSFFRDPEAFEVLREEIIPRLFEGRDPDQPVRIWHACCATGEEVYSMAILIQEFLQVHRLNVRVQLFASDIDETAIAQARAGLYPDDVELDLGRERLDRFFTRTNGCWQVKKQLREMVVFAHHSLIKDPPFSRLDLLVCRNFLIYLNPDMQKRLITLFHQVLKTGGTLFLGNAETVGRNSELFATIDTKWKIFERLESSRRPETVFPLATSVRMPTPHRRVRPAEDEPNPGKTAERLLMERYSPPCVVVNDKFETVHVTTRLNRFLEVPTGEPTRDILRMARENLRPTLRAAIYKSFTEQKRVEFRGVKIANEGGDTTVDLIVEPLGQVPGSRLAMVIFEQGSIPSAKPVNLPGEEDISSGETTRETLICQLEEQLRVTHEQLQATSEQLETSNESFMSANEELMSINEEFQSANEELQSTNEELETSKEEMQALNEELITVNAELQGKVEELNQATSNMENLLSSSKIATLFLDRELHIRGFTPAAAVIFNLISSDIGRPFRHLAGKIDWPTLSNDAETVLRGLPFTEREVASLDRELCYLERIFPYLTQDGSIDGVVVTFIDITDHKRMEEQTIHLASFPQLNPNPVLEVDSAGVVIFANPATGKFLNSLGMDAKTVEVFLPADLDRILREWDRESETTLSREITIRDRTFGETIFLTPQFDVARIYAFDISERKRAEEALRESEERVRRKLESIISPEVDIGDLDLADIIDTPAVQSLMDDFYELTRMPMGLIDIKGKVLVGVGWQDVCTKFHRVHPDSCRNCVDSDVHLSAGIPHGEYKVYRCRNNMWDVATPVMVGDRQFGNLFVGQFFFDDDVLDYDLFRSQARQYEFDEKEYISALEAVPRLSRETLNTSMSFFMKLADILSKLSYSNLKLARSLGERDALMDSLRESEKRFRTLFERHRAIMLLIEPESGAIVDANAAAVEFYGHSREELLGLKIQEFNQLSPEEVAAERRRAVEEQRNHFVFPHRIASGGVRWVEVYSTPVEAQGKSLLFSIIHDISDRKRAEQALQESELFYRQTLESIPAMVFTTRPDGYCDYQSQQWVDFTGVPMIEHMGDGWNKLLHPDDRPRAFAAWQAAVEERAPYDLEYRVRRHDGEYEWFKVHGRPIRHEDGEIVRWFGTASNIDHLHRTQEELRLAKETAEAATRVKSQFLANMSHELRTPMTGVIGMLDVVLSGNLETEQREFIETAKSSAFALVTILNDILDLTKIEVGKMSILEKPFSIRKSVEQTFNILLPVAKGKELDFSFIVADDVPETLVGDQVRLSQVLTNLAGNGVKFTENGKVEIRVTSCGCAPCGKRKVTFTVSDTGIGIPDDKKGLLFNIFSQVDESHSRVFGGTGLGLSITKELVELMGGTITVTSEEGKGSSFSCTIPFGETESEMVTNLEPGKSAPAENTHSADERIKAHLLVAEDDHVIRNVLGTMLKMFFHETDFAENGHKAVEMWESGSYDLILMDVQMPKMNGFEATAAIREIERTSGGHIPIVAMTAHALKEDEERCLDAGMDAYVSKPIDFKNTLEVIRETLKNMSGIER